MWPAEVSATIYEEDEEVEIARKRLAAKVSIDTFTVTTSRETHSRRSQPRTPMKPTSPSEKTSAIPCPSCDEGDLVPFVSDFKTETDGKRFTVPDVAMERCSVCGETLLTPAGSKHVSEYLARATESLEVQELRQFLDKYDLTQKEAAQILGIGEKNFSRWLNGKQRVSTSISNYIRTLTAHPEAFETLRKKQWKHAAPA